MTFDLGYIARQKKQGPIPSINAVGGLEYQREINGVNYKIHEFTSTNIITFQIVPGVVDCFLLGGGGGGGSSTPAGGGGAGGIITATNISVLPNVPYIVTVGAGGSTGNPGNNGADSSITFNGYLSISAQGGGGGGSSTVLPGRAGASGGGAGASSGSSPQQGGAAIVMPVRQGYPGGAGTWQTGTSAGGGGGFTQAGVNASSGIPGRGGDGITLTFTGVLIDYAGGGNATGASGAGLAGGSTANRGGGGNSGNNGGSGIVYIRYPFNPN